MAEVENQPKSETSKDKTPNEESKTKEETPAKKEKEVTLQTLFDLLTAQNTLIEELKNKIDTLEVRAGGNKATSNSPMKNFDDGILRIVEDYEKDKILLHGKKGSMAFKDSVFKPNNFRYEPATDYGPGWVGKPKDIPQLVKLLDKANAGRRAKVDIKKVKRADMDKIASKLASIDDEDEDEVELPKTSKAKVASSKKPASSEDDASSSEDEKPKAPAKPATRKLASKSPAKASSKKKAKSDSESEDDAPKTKAKPKPKASGKKKAQSDSDNTDSD